MRFSSLVVVAVALLSGGCSPLEDLDGERLKHIASYAATYKHNLSEDHNVLDRALSECSEGTIKAETTCVKDALTASAISSSALTAIIPGCKPKQVCRYDHETRRKLGLVEATATLLVRHWRVEVDLRTPTPDLATIPLTVSDRDHFASDDDDAADQTPKRVCTPRSKGPFACR